MDSELVSGSMFTSEESEHRIIRPPFSTYEEQFNEVFPYYLSIGMTYDQFWNGDPILAKQYRQADELRQERRNQELWLQGMYIYEALCDVAPVLRAFAGKGAKPAKYSEEPYAITPKQRKRIEEEREKKLLEKGKSKYAYEIVQLAREISEEKE